MATKINTDLYNKLYDCKDKLTSIEYKDLCDGVSKLIKQKHKKTNTFEAYLHIVKPTILYNECENKDCNRKHFVVVNHKHLVKVKIDKDLALHIQMELQKNHIYTMDDDEIEDIEVLENNKLYLFWNDELEFKTDKGKMVDTGKNDYIVDSSVDVFMIQIVK